MDRNFFVLPIHSTDRLFNEFGIQNDLESTEKKLLRAFCYLLPEIRLNFETISFNRSKKLSKINFKLRLYLKKFNSKFKIAQQYR